MNIVVLDGFTMNPGDLSWDPLRAIGPCRIHDRTPPDQVVVRAADAEIVLTNKALLPRAVIEQLPRLKYIGVLATGTNIVDLDAARERGIPVTNVPAYSSRSVAQVVFALILELTHHVGHHAQTVRDGKWTRCPDFSYSDFSLIELEGLTMGIVGFGRIGVLVAEIAHAFGMNVLAHSRSAKAAAPFVQFVELEPLLRRSDIVSLHCPLTPETRKLVNAQRLGWMKPTAFLINSGRGPLVDEAELADALNSGKLAGAGLDVLCSEPPPADNPLLGARNCVITPHYAWASLAARRRLMRGVVENVRAFLAGRPQNVVN